MVLKARILNAIPVPGWTSLMIVLLLTSGVQLIMLGVLGEYTWRGLDQGRRRPLFVIEALVEEPGPAQQGPARVEPSRAHPPGGKRRPHKRC